MATTLYDSLDSEMEEEEDEEERLLSRQHGEAAEEDAPRNKRKDVPDMNYSGEAAKKRIARPKVTPEKLTGLNGLIRIPDDFKASLRTVVPRGDAKSAAKYTSTLMKLYTNVCFDLLPHHATADVLSQIENLGSKKEVKTYLQNMRDAARNRHVEQLLGREKADKLLNELELGLRQQQEADHYAPAGGERPEEHVTGGVEAEQQQRSAPSQPSPLITRNESQIPAHAITKRFGRKSIHDDSDDDDEEHEAVFDDVEEPNSVISPVEKEKRVLPEQEDSDDDDHRDDSSSKTKASAKKQQDGEETESIQTDLNESSETDMPTGDNLLQAWAEERETSEPGEEPVESTGAVNPPTDTEEPEPTQVNDQDYESMIPLAQATQDIQDSQPSSAREHQSQMSEAPTVVADTQSMDFETQMSQVNDESYYGTTN